MGKLEKLLNTLIQRGWKPFGRETRHELSSGVVYDTIDFKGKRDIWVIDRRHHHIRELVAKESGLWQFCMSKGFTPNVSCYRWEKWFYDIDDLTQCEADVSDNYWYRVIESALCNEEDLEDFLLDNIKIEGN